jgi:hypothetical protein
MATCVSSPSRPFDSISDHHDLKASVWDMMTGLLTCRMATYLGRAHGMRPGKARLGRPVASSMAPGRQAPPRSTSRRQKCGSLGVGQGAFISTPPR